MFNTRSFVLSFAAFSDLTKKKIERLDQSTMDEIVKVLSKSAQKQGWIAGERCVRSVRNALTCKDPIIMDPDVKHLFDNHEGPAKLYELADFLRSTLKKTKTKADTTKTKADTTKTKADTTKTKKREREHKFDEFSEREIRKQAKLAKLKKTAEAPLEAEVDEAEAPPDALLEPDVEPEAPLEVVKCRLNEDDVVKLTELVLNEIDPLIQSIGTKAELRNLLGRCLAQIVVVNLRDAFEAGKINL